MFTKEQLSGSLASAGLLHTDSVVIHSSASSIGEVEGGNHAVLEVFTEYFAKEGLCVFPTLTYTLLHPWNPESGWCKSCKVPRKYCFAFGLKPDEPRKFYADMPACTGALANLFLKMPGVCRSLSVTSSVAALGPDAAEFTSGHENCLTGCSKGSPWEKLLLRNGKILLIGVSTEEMTFLHGVVEWACPNECRSPEFPMPVKAYNRQGEPVRILEHRRVANISRLSGIIEEPLRQGGAITDFTFGNARCMLADCRKTYEITADILHKNPSLL